MNRKRRLSSPYLTFSRFIFLILFIGLGGYFAATMDGCAGDGGGDTSNDIGQLNEIREYQGEALSSINDFRENSIIGPQYVDQETYELQITGLVENPISYSYDDIVDNFSSYAKVVTLNCVEGWSVKLLWEGILVRDVIEAATPSEDATIIIFHAYDRYATSFPIEYVLERDIMMAYKMNEVILPPERGFPFQLVAEDKWGYKWCKWITEIELSDDEGYLGFWESRGYSNDGSLSDCSPGPVSAQPVGHPDRQDCCTCHSAE